ncbi:uncharacterized protein LOC122517172 [Polistes fuscatus]|uniref:uncharacterized protein LOC122517172 n=1 Tax=Polistes fuscatus TaxID=30207 RepID=UPI001CA9E213|nr:uncharacterized protein LOC122517172 [Polistes fuscatus]
MKLLRYVSLISLLAILSFVTADEELYSDKYDYIDPMEIVNNDRLRDQYYNCFMNTGPCVTPDAIYFKEHFPEAVVTKCKKCTEIQKSNFEKLAIWYNENRPDEWTALIKKFMEDAKKLKKITMTRYVVLLLVMILSTIISSVLTDNTKYSSKYDNIDVDTILKTPRLLNQYINCYMERGPCLTADAKFLKDILPEALVTKCVKCTEKQKIILDKMISWFDENDKETWKSILSKAIEKHLDKKNHN